MIEDFSLTALSCPYGPKLKIHVGNWAEALSVISTLWPKPTLQTQIYIPLKGLKS